MRDRSIRWLGIGLAAIWAVACGSKEDDGIFGSNTNGTGDAGNAGKGSGGATATGGRANQGGAALGPSFGGAPAQPGPGGSGGDGEVGAGGEAATVTGGSAGTAGAEQGGAAPNGGATASGGTKASGGKVSTGGGGSGNAASGGAGDSGEAEPVAKAFCEAARACCDKAGKTGPQNCEAMVPLQLDPFALAGRGLLGVDETRLEACVAAFEQAQTSCVLTGLLEKCSRIWNGSIPAGEPCDTAAQCDQSAGPMFCVRNLETGSQSEPGVCAAAPRGSNGDECVQSCAEGADCSGDYFGFGANPVLTVCHEADGLFCESGDDSARCAPFTATGGSCESPSECHPSEACDVTCKPKVAAGQACGSAWDCRGDLLCIEGECAGAPFATDSLCGGNLSSSGLN